jgi:hypothetical protein
VGSRNGYIRKSLELGRQLSPQDVDTLRLGRAEVLLGLAESDKERSQVEECLASGWEERPAQTRLYNRLALRVVDEADRQVLTRAEGFRILLPEAMPEPPVDPQLEQLILDQAARTAAAQAAADATQRLYIAALVRVRKLDPASDSTKALKIRAAALRQDYEESRDRLDKEQGRLAQLLSLRAERKRRLLLAEATKR